MAHTNLKPTQSKLLTSGPIYANQNDLLAMENRIKGDQRHLQTVFKSGKLFGPMSEADQLDAIQYAFGIRGIIPEKKKR